MSSIKTKVQEVLYELRATVAPEQAAKIDKILAYLEGTDIVQLAQADKLAVNVNWTKPDKNGKVRLYWNLNGKRYNGQTVNEDDAPKLAKILEERINNQQSGGQFKKVITVGWEQFKREFMEHKSSEKVTQSTIDLYYDFFNAFERLVGKPDTTIITTKTIENFRLRRSQDKRRFFKEQKNLTRTITAKTVNRDLVMLKTMLTWGVGEGYIREMPKIVMLDPVDKAIRILTDEETEKLIAYATAHYPKMMLAMRIMFNSGQRLGDVIRLAWEQVNFETNTIKFFQKKTNKWIDIPMKEGLMQDLNKYMLELPDGQKWVFHQKDPTNRRTAHIFPYGSWYRMRNALKLHDVRIHDIRKTVATWLCEHYGEGVAMAMGGWNNSVTLHKNYVDASKQKSLKRASESLPVQ